MPRPLFITEENLALATDLYEFTMAAGYFAHGREDAATFELFVRDMPASRGFLVAAGLEQALDGLLSFRFSPRSVDFIRGLPAFRNARVPEAFFERLSDFRFTGDVWAVDEGRAVFAEEPLLRVTAPIIEAQVVETYLLSTVSFQTAVASKAARVVAAAAGRDVVDFGSRRAHGAQAGALAARAAYIAGCAGTSNVLAGRELGVPVIGTAAHSWTMSWGSEEEAFRRYREVFPEASVLLVDTYDTLRGVRRAAATGPGLKGVRLDSGDLARLSREARRILDETGQESAKIVASGDLDEHRIADLVASGAQIDVFGVGTRMVTSYDAPALGVVYKLVEVGGTPTLKSSEGKATYPGAKQVFRFRDGDGRLARDVLARADEALAGGEPMLCRHVEKGRLVRERSSVGDARRRALEELDRLPEGIRRPSNPECYPVERTQALERLRGEVWSRTNHGG